MGILDKLFRPDIAGLFARKDQKGLMSALQQKDLKIRWQALLALNDGTIRPMAWGEVTVLLLKEPGSIPILESLLAAHGGFCGAFEVLGLLWSTAAKFPTETKPALAMLNGSLCALLNDENSQVRKFAALVLGCGAMPDAVDPLVQALRDSDHDARNSAIEALGAIGDAKALDAMIGVFREDLERHRKNPNDNSYEFAATGIGLIRDTRAVDALAAALARTSDDRESQIFRGALVTTGELALAPMIKLLKTGNTRAKCSAAVVLGAIRIRVQLIRLSRRSRTTDLICGPASSRPRSVRVPRQPWSRSHCLVGDP